ncbi:MAG: hypothetical protein GX817_02940, partial [Elusimicrobia bacterium]|nr:hypothetical protein [Elusimicrobiota bacterium]
MAQAEIEGPNKIIGLRIRLRKNYILRSLKFRPELTQLGAAEEKLFQDSLEEAYSLINPSVIFTSFFSDAENFKEILDELTLSSSHVAALTKKAVAFTLMASTIGPSLEKRVAELKEKDLARAFILDAAGSEAAEQSVNFVSRLLKNRAETRDFRLLKRYSPGYGDWPIEASRRILSYLPFEKIGISITRSGNM